MEERGCGSEERKKWRNLGSKQRKECFENELQERWKERSWMEVIIIEWDIWSEDTRILQISRLRSRENGAGSVDLIFDFMI